MATPAQVDGWVGLDVGKSEQAGVRDLLARYPTLTALPAAIAEALAAQDVTVALICLAEAA